MYVLLEKLTLTKYSLTYIDFTYKVTGAHWQAAGKLPKQRVLM